MKIVAVALAQSSYEKSSANLPDIGQEVIESTSDPAFPRCDQFPTVPARAPDECRIKAENLAIELEVSGADALLVLRFEKPPKKIDGLMERIHRGRWREIGPQSLKSLVARGCHTGSRGDKTEQSEDLPAQASSHQCTINPQFN